MVMLCVCARAFIFVNMFYKVLAEIDVNHTRLRLFIVYVYGK